MTVIVQYFIVLHFIIIIILEYVTFYAEQIYWIKELGMNKLHIVIMLWHYYLGGIFCFVTTIELSVCNDAF